MRRFSLMITLFLAAFAVTWLLKSGTPATEAAPPEVLVETRGIVTAEHSTPAAVLVEDSVEATPGAREPGASLADLASDADADTQAEAQMLLVLLSEEQ